MAKKDSTSKERIAEMMSVLNLKQVDIVKKTGIPKSSLSNYLSGKRTPNQEQLSVIADPYGINPAWLMGYNVPMWLKDTPAAFSTPEEFEIAWYKSGGGKHPIKLSEEEYSLILTYRSADDTTKDMINRMLKYRELLEKRLNNANR